MYDYLIVGSGPFGSVCTERLASVYNKKVLIIDKRNHLAGNCYSEVCSKSGVEVHKYGTHIFHTSNDQVWNYLNKFTKFNNYQHQVLTNYNDKIYQMPINLSTINSYYNIGMNPEEAKIFLNEKISSSYIENPQNLQEKAINLIGVDLYNAFIKGYTIKQWNKDPSLLPASIINRIPVRYNYNKSYFLNDLYQGIPVCGYTELFKRIITHENIDTKLNCDYFLSQNEYRSIPKTIYTGPIDRFYNYKYGKLEWRSVRFEEEVLEMEDYQGTSVMNYANEEIPYTRIHEPKHLHPERKINKDKTIIIREYSQKNDEEPYYPIRNGENLQKYQQYKKETEKNKDVIFGGRLGTYSYYDMDQVIYRALKLSEYLEGHE